MDIDDLKAEITEATDALLDVGHELAQAVITADPSRTKLAREYLDKLLVVRGLRRALKAEVAG